MKQFMILVLCMPCMLTSMELVEFESKFIKVYESQIHKPRGKFILIDDFIEQESSNRLPSKQKKVSFNLPEQIGNENIVIESKSPTQTYFTIWAIIRSLLPI